MKLCVMVVLLLLGTNCFSQIYKWVDENGKTHFSDKPVPGTSDSEMLDLPEPNTSEPLLVRRRAPEVQAPAEVNPAGVKGDKMNEVCREAEKEYRQLTVGAGGITVLTEDGKAITRLRQNRIAEEFRRRMNSQGCKIQLSHKKLKL